MSSRQRKRKEKIMKVKIIALTIIVIALLGWLIFAPNTNHHGYYGSDGNGSYKWVQVD